MASPAPFFDSGVESRRFLARSPLLKRQWAMRVDLAPGIVFQPETLDSIEDQIAETLWAEGVALEEAAPALVEELRGCFQALTPGREQEAVILTATLLLGFPESSREEAFRALDGLPGQLHLELSDGSRVAPLVDSGVGPSGRLQAVLALRYRVPVDAWPVGLFSNHGGAPGAWPAPAAWAQWREHSADAAVR